MEVSDIKPNRIITTDEIKKLYDGYVKAYNDSKETIDRIRLTSDFSSIHQGYIKAIKPIKDNIEGFKKVLKRGLNRQESPGSKTIMIDGVPTFVPASIPEPVDQIKIGEILGIIETISDELMNRYTTEYYISSDLKDLVKAYKKLPNELPIAHVSILRDTFNLCIDYSRINTQIQILNTIIKQIGISGHPTKLKKYDELAKPEKNTIHPANWAGELSSEQIGIALEFRKNHPKLGINEFCKKLWNEEKKCQHVINDEGDQIEISWATLRNRISKYLDIKRSSSTF